MQNKLSIALVGAGPVGLTLALLLANEDIDVQVFEAEADISEDLRASTFHPPTLDMLDTLGVAAPLVAQGLICPHWQVRLHPSGERAVFDLSTIADDTAHPYRLQCEQWKLSRLLLARLAATNAKVHFQSRVDAVSQDDSGATVTFSVNDEAATLRADYVIGCDGARSIVRKMMGVEFAGETYPETTILATTDFPFHEVLDGLSNVSYCWKEAGRNFSLLRLPGLWRTSIYPPENAPIEDSLTEEAIQKHFGEIHPTAADAKVLEVRPYRVHQRIASHYRQDRLLLSGDAAHLNSPAGGMGMNGGIHDAFNLADKLIRVAKGASDELLDVYERQRRPVARDQIIAQADANRARMRETDPAKRVESLRALQALTSDPVRLKTHLLKTSMISGLRQAAEIG